MTTAPPPTRSLFHLFPKQQYALNLIFGQGHGGGSLLAEGVDQLLYGGAAGGGKSGFVRALACYVANLWPGSEFAIFRRTDKELHANHIGKWMEEIDPYVPGGRFFAQKMEYHWPSPAWCWCPKHEPCAHSSKTLFLHVDDNRAEKKHQGAEHAAQALDEATHFKGYQVDYLYTRVRATEGKQFPHDVLGPDGKTYAHPGWPNWRPLQLLTANPGDVGHQYMLDTYIDPEGGLLRDDTRDMKRIIGGPQQLTDPDGRTIWTTDIIDLRGNETRLDVDLTDCQYWTVEIDPGPGFERTSLNRAFIKAKIRDNPALNAAEYAAGLAVGSEEQRKRLLDGDWTFFEGKTYSMLNPDIHFIDAARIFGEGYLIAPHDWPRMIGLDHGILSAAEWMTKDRDGFFIVYQEYYEQGTVSAHIAAIKDLMERDGHTEIMPIADPQMFRKNRGHEQLYSVADEYRWAGPPPDGGYGEPNGIALQKRLVERETGRMVLQRLLEPRDDRMFPHWHPQAGRYGAPGIFIARQCANLWRELNNVRYIGDGNEDTVKEDDHAYDALWHALPVFERETRRPVRSGPVMTVKAKAGRRVR